MNNKIKIDTILKVLSDPSRLKILSIIYTSDVCICDIVNFMDFSYPTVTQHLKLLNEIGIIILQKQGKLQLCKFNNKPKDKRLKFIVENFEFLFKEYLLKKTELQKLKKIITNRVCEI